MIRLTFKNRRKRDWVDYVIRATVSELACKNWAALYRTEPRGTR